jgi:chemotaxis protein histidine kinase CheA
LSDRRQAIVARFRASAVDRLRKIAVALIDIEGGRGTPEQVEEVLRELHTIKGESKMLDFGALAETVHAAEGRLLKARPAGERSTRMAASAVLRSLDIAAHWLRAEPGEDSLAAAALASARDNLLHPTMPPPALRASEVPPAAVPQPPPEPDAARADAGRAPASGGGVGAAPFERWVSVSARQIDDVCERVSEFETEFRALQFAARELLRTTTRETTAARGLRGLVAEFDRCRAHLDEIASASWALRLVPIEPLLAELLAHARDLAVAQHKSLRIVLDAGRVQLERSILDALSDPLLHLIRNAVDHGIEPASERLHKGEAQIAICAGPSGQSVVLSVTDNGRGIDRQAVRAAAVSRGVLTEAAASALRDSDVLGLLFIHGFSTRTEVSDVSGRGVGLDVVRAAVEGVGGVVGVTSELGTGTRFTLEVPASISKEQNLVIEVGANLYAIPSRYIAGLVRIAPSGRKQVAGGEAILYEDRLIPLHSISTAVGAVASEDEPVAIVLDGAGGRSAFAVPRLVGEFSLQRRPIDRLVGSSSLICASAAFEDGRLILILSLGALARQRRTSISPPSHGPVPSAPIRVLTIDDSATVRDLLVELLGRAGFEVSVAASSEEGLSAVTRHTPDLVLLDVDMPGMNGFDVLREMRGRGIGVPVVMLSARSSDADQERAASLGASAYLVKARFQDATFASTLRRLVAPAR